MTYTFYVEYSDPRDMSFKTAAVKASSMDAAGDKLLARMRKKFIDITVHDIHRAGSLMVRY